MKEANACTQHMRIENNNLFGKNAEKISEIGKKMSNFKRNLCNT